MAWRVFPDGVPWSKRLLDLGLTIPGMLLISPLLLVLAALVRLRLGSPILFRQTRPGLRGAPFTLFKFRTMAEHRDASGVLLPDSERITSMGRLLRSFSLDELPELVNVLRGEMSLVGPRPLLLAYLDRYTPEQARRHDALPGMTGWAQIRGRNAISWEEKFTLDLWYVDNWSLWLDVRILAETMLKAIRREGVSPAGQDTADEYQGPGKSQGGPDGPIP